jgi:ribonuclease BN (tRNA processing enzyme)
MRVIFLGTNGWYDTATGNTISVAIDTASFIIILDAGNGIAKLDQYITQDRPAYLFLSHLHVDHIAGLHVISKFSFPKGLSICGHEGIASLLGSIMDAPFTVPPGSFRYTVKFIELPRQEDSLPFVARSLPLVHPVTTLGYRFEIEGKTVAYIGDTGYCANAVTLGRDADLLITECAYRSGEDNPDWPHLNPEMAARIAVEGGAKKLALVHFEAELYRTMEDRKNAEAVARTIFPDTVATADGLIIDL